MRVIRRRNVYLLSLFIAVLLLLVNVGFYLADYHFKGQIEETKNTERRIEQQIALTIERRDVLDTTEYQADEELQNYVPTKPEFERFYLTDVEPTAKTFGLEIDSVVYEESSSTDVDSEVALYNGYNVKKAEVIITGVTSSETKIYDFIAEILAKKRTVVVSNYEISSREEDISYTFSFQIYYLVDESYENALESIDKGSGDNLDYLTE